MTIHTKHISRIFAKLVLSITVPTLSFTVSAQELPTLEQAPNVVSGRLSNGVSYYIVTNKSAGDKADVALVQKAGLWDETSATAGHSVVAARGSISELPHFPDRHSPFSFMNRKNIFPSGRGFVEVDDESTIFRFKDIQLGDDRQTLDSTLLMVFDMIGKGADGLVPELYSPKNQAIVIAGGVDAQGLTSMMNILSMLVTKTPAATVRRDWQWVPTSRKEVVVEESHIPGTASVSVQYRSPRVPVTNMNTIQPIVSELFATEMSVIVRQALETNLKAAAVPYSSVDFEYLSSARTFGDEHYTITVNTLQKNLTDAIEVTARTLSAIKQFGVLPEEYEMMQKTTLTDLFKIYGHGSLSNAEYVDQCISAFLTGASIPSPDAVMEFFRKRVLDPETGVRLFNNFTGAILDSDRNLTLTIAAQPGFISADEAGSLFNSGWKSVKDERTPLNYRPLKDYVSKVRIAQAVPEPMTGGQIWTLSNGIKVVFKKVDNARTFHYAWLLKGGYSIMPSIKAGESARLADMLGLYSVGGMSSSEFWSMLHANGIYLEPHVSLSDLTLRGMAPNPQFPLLMQALTALSKDRMPDMEAFEAYRRNEEARMLASSLSPDRRLAVADSIFHPGNIYTDYRQDVPVSDDFVVRAGKYWNAVFAKMNDGVLIIVGDFEEEALKKMISSTMGGFRTEKVSSYRSRLKIKNIASRMTLWDDAVEPSLSMLFSAETNCSIDNFIAAQIAGSVLQSRVSRAAAKHGWTARSSWKMEIFPQEAFKVFIDLTCADPEGMPASMVPTDSVETVLSDVRTATLMLANDGIGKKEVTDGRIAIERSLGAYFSYPEGLLDMLLVRYSFGKDLMTNYKEKVKSASATTVNEILKGLVTRGVAEYAVRTTKPAAKIVEPEISVPEIEVAKVSKADLSGQLTYPMPGDTVAHPSSANLFEEYAAWIRRQPKPKVEPIKGPKKPAPATAPADSLKSASDSLLNAPVDSLKAVLGMDKAVIDTLAVPADSLMTAAVDTVKSVSGQHGLPTTAITDTTRVGMARPVEEKRYRK